MSNLEEPLSEAQLFFNNALETLTLQVYTKIRPEDRDYVHCETLKDFIREFFLEEVENPASAWALMENTETFQEFLTRQTDEELTEFSEQSLGNKAFKIVSMWAMVICNRAISKVCDVLNFEITRIVRIEDRVHVNFLYAWYRLLHGDSEELVKACKD